MKPNLRAMFAAFVLLLLASLGVSLPALAQGAARSVAWLNCR